MKLKYISLIGLTAPLAAAGGVDAQIVIPGTVNQISGDVLFSNAPLLEPLHAVSVSTTSVGVSPARAASSQASFSPGSFLADYTVTVLSEGGTAHDVSVRATLDGGRDGYDFAPQRSALVNDEPADDVLLDFSECAGFVRVNFLDEDGQQPEAVTSMSSSSQSETSAGSGAFGGQQAWTGHSNTSSEVYAVRGDGLLHRITTVYRLGVVPFVVVRDLPVNCNETVDIDIPIGTGEDVEPGGIRGSVDLRFEDEIANTTVRAVNGPYNLSGSTTIAAGSGPFQITDLYPSTAVSPVDPYTVYADMSFPSDSGELQFFRTPYTEVTVPEGGFAFLGNTYIMEAGYLEGNVHVGGPRDCIEAMGNANSFAEMQAYGANAPSNGGAAEVPLVGSITVPTPTSTRADYTSPYVLAMGTPNNVPGAWRPRLESYFQDPVNARLNSRYYYTDHRVGDPVIPPGGPAQQVNVDHCLARVVGRVEVNVNNPGGTAFNNPRISFGGGLQDELRHYTVSGNAAGAPSSGEGVQNIGHVEMCVPYGDYYFDTTVSARASSGVFSETQLPRRHGSFNCEADVNPFGFKIDVTEQICTGVAALPFSAEATTVIGSPTPARSAYALINQPRDAGDPPAMRIELCGPQCAAGDPACPQVCGVDPTLDFNVATLNLNQCVNDVEVFVTDDLFGEESRSGHQEFIYERDGATSCAPLSAKPNTAVDIEAHLGINACGLPTTHATCMIVSPTGTTRVVDLNQNPEVLFAPIGKHRLFCSLNMQCGTTRSCNFTATINN